MAKMKAKLFLKYSAYIIIFLVSILGIFIVGVNMGGKDKVKVSAFKFVQNENGFVKIEGLLKANNFKAALKPRAVLIKCFRFEEPFCTWSEFSAIKSLGTLSSEVFFSDQIEKWDNSTLIINADTSNYKRKIMVNFETKSMVESYKTANGDYREMRLSGSFED